MRVSAVAMCALLRRVLDELSSLSPEECAELR